VRIWRAQLSSARRRNGHGDWPAWIGQLGRLGSENGGRLWSGMRSDTDLQRLIDLSPEEASKIGAAVVELLDRRLIETVEP